MRTLYLTLTFSLIAHTIALFSLSSVPEITLPSNEAMVITLTAGSAGSGSLKAQNTANENKPNKTEPLTKKSTPQTAKPASTTPKVLHTKERQAAQVTPVEKNTTNKAQTQNNQKNTLAESQTESSNSGKNGKQGESSSGSGAGVGVGSGTGTGSSGNQGSGKGSGGSGSGKMTAPVPTYSPVPAYPSAAERLQQQGTVRAALKVTVNGSVSDVTILRSSQSSLLDNAAKRTLKSWRFKAAEQDGHAIPSSVTINVLFTPEGVKILR